MPRKAEFDDVDPRKEFSVFRVYRHIPAYKQAVYIAARDAEQARAIGDSMNFAQWEKESYILKPTPGEIWVTQTPFQPIEQALNAHWFIDGEKHRIW